MFRLNRNERSYWSGNGVHVESELVFMIGRNMQGQLIGSLQTEVTSSQQLMSTGIARSVSTVEGTEQAFEALNQVVTQIQQIHDHISQVATAAEQQSAVSDTINQNLMRIGDAATTLGQEANASQRLSEALEQAATTLASELDRLRT
ncbi:hypothetical protein KAM346_15110 [Aeromonas caviae]|nr:hypothetical protein KAM346_15110 [Aeromonas caviae]